jgi:simple sugar transport system ATP-binding protein
VIEFDDPADAIEHGVGMIHQEFMLVEPFTVAENLMMGTTTLPEGATTLNAARRLIREISADYSLHVDPDDRIEELSVGQRQRVEILKLLFRHAKLLILDEPTAVLTPQETDALFEVLDRLRANDHAIVIVTHKMHEVMAISDRVSVMRNGKMPATVNTAETTDAELVRLMVGRDLDLELDRQKPARTEPALEVVDLVLPGREGAKLSPPASFVVNHGEVLGIAGVDGNGQTELIEALFGLREANSGTVRLQGRDIGGLDTAGRRAAGFGYVPPDRRGVGALITQSIEDNVILGASKSFTRSGFIDRSAARQAADTVIERFGVKTPDADFISGKLSGGNLQKLVLGREVSRGPELLLIEQPTRGLDVGAIELVWAEIIAQRNEGAAILMASTELEEILALSDRIAVMFEGEIMGILPRAQATTNTLGALMAGQPLETLDLTEAMQ